MVALIADEVDQDKGGHYIHNDKRVKSIHQEDKTTLNVHAPNKRTSKYMKQN